MNAIETKIIAGVEFEAVRMSRPIPHWRPRVIETGCLIEAGVFKSESRPKMWESMEYTARRIGKQRFQADMLSEQKE
jgi:hypothetical protein